MNKNKKNKIETEITVGENICKRPKFLNIFPSLISSEANVFLSQVFPRIYTNLLYLECELSY